MKCAVIGLGKICGSTRKIHVLSFPVANFSLECQFPCSFAGRMIPSFGQNGVEEGGWSGSNCFEMKGLERIRNRKFICDVYPQERGPFSGYFSSRNKAAKENPADALYRCRGGAGATGDVGAL